MKKFIPALIGIFTGFANGIFGSGGGTVAVPAMEKFLASCTLGKQMPEPEPLIFARISDAGVERRTIEEKIP